MAKPAPPIDQRTADQIVQQLQDLLRVYTPKWQDNNQRLSDPIGIALIHIFARFAEIIIQRLNQVLDQNFLAFLDLLGASRLPPQPARVPLTFFLAEGTLVDAVVPAGTQVAAPPTEGKSNPVIFETERELVVTAASLTAIFIDDPEQDQYGDRISLIQTPSHAVPVWRGDRQIDHILYIGSRQLLSFPEIENLSITLDLEQVLGDSASVAWEIWQGTDWEPLSSNTPQNLRQINRNSIDFGSRTIVPLTPVNGLENRWLRCRLLTPLTPAATPQAGMVRATQVPKIRDIMLTVNINRGNLAIASAFSNQSPVDLSKDFLPFGERPKFGDTLYLANREAFSAVGATVTLTINISNPVTASSAIATRPSDHLNLTWEFWNGSTWEALGVTTRAGVTQPTGTYEFQDTTKAFSDRLANNTPGQVKFKVPSTLTTTRINGLENLWIRVRITAGNYGEEARYEPVTVNNQTYYQRVGESFSPPFIQSIQVSYELNKPEKPDTILTYNNFVYSDNLVQILNQPEASFTPFQISPLTQPTLYFGFTLPSNRNLFPNRPISLFSRIAESYYREKLTPISPNYSQRFNEPGTEVEHEFYITNPTSKTIEFQIELRGTIWQTELTTPARMRLNPQTEARVSLQVTIPQQESIGNRDRGFLQLINLADPSKIYSATFATLATAEPPNDENPRLIWEYFNNQNWQPLIVQDETQAFTRPGLVEFLPPADFSSTLAFGLRQYWLRVRWEQGNYAVEPRLEEVLLNTTMATQTVTFQDEILGSSNGSENQVFYINHTPILTGQQLEVRESELDSSDQPSLVLLNINSLDRMQEIWIPWQEVSDFYSSEARDRHYTLNPITGEIRFGDGRNGLIPPVGAGNILMRHYQSGGGTAGNQPSGVIVQLTTTVPYIDRVMNREAATGGAEAEPLDFVRDRIPRQIRHRNRAVTQEDYEDLAKLASPEVARAKCVPLFDLSVSSTESPRPGVLSLIIIPRSPSANPLPSLELISRVQNYLDRRRLPTARLVVVGPSYVPIEITAEIALTALEQASAVESVIHQTLAQFLHPLTGGSDRTGWDFGRQPHKSDLYALLEAIPGVDYVRTLKIPQINDSGLFLVYSGNHKISLIV